MKKIDFINCFTLVGIGLLSNISTAEEVNLLINGVAQTGNLNGTPIVLNLSYDSSKKSIYPYDSLRSDYRFNIGSGAEIFLQVGDKEYYPDIQYGATGDLMLSVTNNAFGKDEIRITLNHPMRDKLGSDIIGSLDLSIPLSDRDSTALPENLNEFELEDHGYSSTQIEYNISTMHESTSVFVTDLQEKPIQGCNRQFTYEIVGTVEPLVPDPFNEIVHTPVITGLTITPNMIKGIPYTQEKNDYGLSSGFNVRLGEVTYSFQEMPNHKSPALTVQGYGNILSISSNNLTDENSQSSLGVELILNNSLLNTNLSIANLSQGMDKDEFAHIDMMISVDGVMRHVAVDNINMVRGGCSVNSKLSLSQNNIYVEPIHDQQSGEVKGRAVIPADGGKVYFDIEITPKSTETKKIRRWREVVLPTGQVLPVGGMKTIKLTDGIPHNELSSPVTIGKNWPDGIYQYRVKTLGVSDWIPEETILYFRKGMLDRYVPLVR